MLSSRSNNASGSGEHALTLERRITGNDVMRSALTLRGHEIDGVIHLNAGLDDILKRKKKVMLEWASIRLASKGHLPQLSAARQTLVRLANAQAVRKTYVS